MINPSSKPQADELHEASMALADEIVRLIEKKRFDPFVGTVGCAVAFVVNSMNADIPISNAKQMIDSLFNDYIKRHEAH